MSNKSLDLTTEIKTNVSTDLSMSDPLPPFRDESAFEKMHHVLASDQIDVLKKMRENLRLHYETGQVFRSEVEMRFSVLNDGKFPTCDAKYWQAVREQNVHFTNLVVLGYEYDTEQIRMKNLKDMIKKHGIKQKKLNRKIEKVSDMDTLDIEEIQLEIEMLQNKIDTLNIELEKSEFFQADRKRVAYNRWREVVTWEKLMLELQPHMQFGVLSYEHHQPGSYEKRMENQYKTMIKSGAKGSPSEAINITNQAQMVKKLLEDGVLERSVTNMELPIDRAVQQVVNTIDAGNNYVNQIDNNANKKLLAQLNAVKEAIKDVPKKVNNIVDDGGVDTEDVPINNPQVPQI